MILKFSDDSLPELMFLIEEYGKLYYSLGYYEMINDKDYHQIKMYEDTKMTIGIIQEQILSKLHLTHSEFEKITDQVWSSAI